MLTGNPMFWLYTPFPRRINICVLVWLDMQSILSGDQTGALPNIKFSTLIVEEPCERSVVVVC